MLGRLAMDQNVSPTWLDYPSLQDTLISLPGDPPGRPHGLISKIGNPSSLQDRRPQRRSFGSSTAGIDRTAVMISSTCRRRRSVPLAFRAHDAAHIIGSSHPSS